MLFSHDFYKIKSLNIIDFLIDIILMNTKDIALPKIMFMFTILPTMVMFSLMMTLEFNFKFTVEVRVIGKFLFVNQ